MASLRRTNPRPSAIVALGDGAILVEFADKLDLATNEFIARLAHALRMRRVAWILDIVPALASLAIHFDPDVIDATQATPLVHWLIDSSLSEKLPPAAEMRGVVEVPVCYDKDFATDLTDICERVRLAPDEVVKRHAAGKYRVLMVGFAPDH